MSVFIHYRGKLATNADIDSLFDFVRKYARQNGWKTLEWEETGWKKFGGGGWGSRRTNRF